MKNKIVIDLNSLEYQPVLEDAAIRKMQNFKFYWDIRHTALKEVIKGRLKKLADELNDYLPRGSYLRTNLVKKVSYQ